MMPHSFLFGHLHILARRTRHKAPNIYPHYLTELILSEWKNLFPFEKKPPPFIYIDFYPFGPPTIFTLNASLPAQYLTQPGQIKHHPDSHAYLYPLTYNLDLFSADGPQWRLWRGILSPGFSPKNITGLVPSILDEVVVFRDILKSHAVSPSHTSVPTNSSAGSHSHSGTDADVGNENEDENKNLWGDVFLLEPVAINLTFDVIVRASLDLRLHEQTRKKPSELKSAMVETLSLLLFGWNLATLGRWLSPVRWWRIRRNDKVMRRFLQERVVERFTVEKEETKENKTIVDLAVEAVRDMSRDDEKREKVDNKLLVETVMAQLKIFIFAGHDTTAGVLCWVLHCMAEHPEAAERVRDGRFFSFLLLLPFSISFSFFVSSPFFSHLLLLLLLHSGNSISQSY